MMQKFISTLFYYNSGKIEPKDIVTKFKSIDNIWRRRYKQADTT